MSYSVKEELELLQLIEHEKQILREKVNYNGGSYEGALELLGIITDPDSPPWKVKICLEVLDEPSPLVDFIERLGMGVDTADSLKSMDEYSH